MPRQHWSSVVHALLGSAAVLLLTYGGYRLQFDLTTGTFFCLIVVLLVSLSGYFIPAAVVSVVALLCVDYFFISPPLSIRVANPIDAIAVIAILATGLAISRLMARLRRSFSEVRALNERLQLVVDTIPSLVARTRPDGSVEFINRRWLEYLGLPLEKANDWAWTSTLHPDDRERFVGQWRAALSSGAPLETEARMRRADGEYHWLSIRVVPLRDSEGRIVNWYGSSTDIEDLKRAEEVLRDRARLLDLTHDSIFVRDVDDVITYWNKGAEELYGWTRKEALGKVCHALMRTIFPASLQDINAELLRTGRWEGELVHTTRDGRQLTLASRWSLQRDERGRAVGTLETNNDITERKRLDTELRRSQAYLTTAQELGNTGSWARRLSTGELYWSAEVFRIFGLDPETTLPRRELLTRLWHPDDRVLAERTIEEAVREQRSYAMDVRIVRPDGALRYVHIRGQPVVDPTGATDEFIGVVMDITARKRTERALRRARERTLAARFAAVLEERTRLARDIHDTLLQGFTGIALKLVAAINRVTGPAESVVALRELVGLAQQTLTDARRAVWDLRSPALAGGDFPAAVRAAAADCVRGTDLALAYAAEGPPRPVDPAVEAVVVRVVQEALTNVVKHADARSVRVRLAFGTRRVRLAVSDDGRGFAVAPDFQAYGGHWGLLGMRERASQVHGRLALRSMPGHGTEVVLLVPYTVGQGSPAPRLASNSTS